MIVGINKPAGVRASTDSASLQNVNFSTAKTGKAALRLNVVDDDLNSNSLDHINLNRSGGVRINTDYALCKLDRNNGTINSTTHAKLFNFKASNPISSSYLGISGYCSLGRYNNLVNTGDSVIVYNGDLTTHGSCVVPHSGLTTGIRIDSSGNVGIDTSNPSGTLDNNGTLQARGQVTICNPSNSACTLFDGDVNLVDYGASYRAVNVARYANAYVRAHLAFIRGGRNV